MQVVLDMGEWGGRPQEENGIDDPCLLLDEWTGDLMLFGTWHHGGRRSAAEEGGFAPDSTGQMMMSRSTDDGLTWSEPVNITHQVKDPAWKSLLEGPGIGITMQDGTLVVPLQFRDSEDIYSATVIYSRDRGQTWQRGHGQIKRYVNESQIAEIEPGVLMINARDRSISGRRAVQLRPQPPPATRHDRTPEPGQRHDLALQPAAGPLSRHGLFLHDAPGSGDPRHLL